MTQPLTSVLTDAETLRGKIHEKVTGALHAVFPLDLKGRTLEVTDVRVHGRDYSSEEQKRALLSGSSLQTAVKGTLVLKGADGKVIDTAKDYTLVHIPYLTDRHTVIADGNEYQFANQLRRKPGVYTERAENGELRTTFNLGRGKNFDLGFNEKKGTFHLQYGASNIPLYPVLRGLGVTHDAIAHHLGEGVAKANQAEHGHQIESAINKLYTKLEHPALVNPKLEHTAKAQVVQKRYDMTTLDRDVTAHTLGKDHDKVTPTALLDAAKKILAVHKGQTPVDDTDSLAFKTFHSVDDFLAERIRLTARAWAPKAKMALTGKTSIREALRPAPFSDSVRKFVTTSTLTAVPSGINPIELLDHAVKVTSLGEGGIASDRAIPLSARMTHSTHFGSLDPIRTPESGHAGVDIRATIMAHRDDKGNLYTPVHDVKSGKDVFLKAGDLMRYVVAFPNQDLKSNAVKAFVNGEVQTVPGSRVTHQLTHVSHQYSPATSLIPMIHNIQGNRAIMGSKMGTQALPLLEREAPYVQVKSHLPGDVSFEAIYGHMTVPVAPVSGKVKKIEGGYIWIEPHKEKQAEKTAAASDAKLVKVPYENHFPFPSKTYLHHDIQVKPGDKVEAGQRLADSNFTRNGVMALGKNLLVGYMPYHGLNSNDAVVISEGCAKKLTSEHMYREVYPLNSGIELSREKHKAYYGNKYSAQQYAKLDDAGVIKAGSRVDPKDPLIVGLTKTQIQGADLMLGRIAKSLTKPYREVVLQWEHGTPGEVVEVFRAANQIAILVKTHEQMNVGDKLAGRFGNKGVVAKIVPDHEMIQDEKGRPLDLILTSAGVVSRINPAQIIETAVGKVVEKTGKPILYDNGEDKNAVTWAKELLKAHNIKDKETVYDPVTKRKITGPDNKGVLVGRQFIYKLFKSTDTNFAGHGVGPYDVNEQPLKTGGDESAKGLGKMEYDALVAHGARNILQEAATVKSQKNDEFWRAIQLGAPLPTPKPTFAFNKFTAMLEGSGIKVDKRGSKFKLLPMTDKGVLERSRGAIDNKKTLIAKNLRPESGGLFDPIKTGGPQGTLFAHIELHEPIPHPVFIDPVRRLLGLSQKDFDAKLQSHGGAWFKQELAKIDLDRKLVDLRAKMARASGPELDDTIKQIKYLEALKKEKLSPADAYIMSKVPVIPPVFRPILPEKRDPSQLMISDANKLYGHLIDTNDVHKNTALESDLGKHRQMVFNAVGAVFGVNDPDDEKLKKQEVKGFLQNIAGVGTPKGGFFQRKLMRRTQDVSGRGTAVPDVNLNMDEVGIPEQMLWQMFDKLIVARLVRQGYGALQARELVDKKAPVAREAMLAETKARPVLINRAPTLHRWSIIAANAIPVAGKTVRVNPFIEKGMNLDFDGDTLQIHGPIQPGAVEDAKRMTLSNLLMSDQTRNKILAFPQHESIIGVTLASKAANTGAATHHFQTRDEALAAWRSGKLKLTDTITIANEKRADFQDEAPEASSLSSEDALFFCPAENVIGHEGSSS
jgi:DNA-directed RNA polymerase subunit beta